MADMPGPGWGPLSPERPLIILQTNNRFNDSDEDFGRGGLPSEEASRHGADAVRAWKNALPDDIKPYCHLQMELRMQNHQERYDRLRRLFTPLEEAGVPVNFQFADPHDMYVFDPEYVEKLLEEFTCIQSMTLTEIGYEHYRSFNVARYAISPEARYAMDVIEMAARHGKYLSISLQALKWMHICTDVLNVPLFDAIRRHSDIVLAVNEHIGPQHLPRQTSVWGVWMAGITQNWGVEPQSWWFENARMITPGLFGQYQADNTRNMPPLLYRAMILQGALLGATVYQFEPFWDLFDYDNSACWRDVIYPTLMEVIRGKMIATREQCFEKTKVAYQCKYARDINEFHENLRDVDFIHDEGYLARAAYGVWEKFLQHELIPNKSRYFFIPIVPPATGSDVLKRFSHVIHPGECGSEAAYERLLNAHYPEENRGSAWTASMNGYTYVMQTHENLYEEQTFAIQVPLPVRGLEGAWKESGLELSWSVDDVGAKAWRVYRCPGNDVSPAEAIGRVETARFVDSTAVRGQSCRYAVCAETSSTELLEGTVNYLDFLVFSEKISRIVEWLVVDGEGALHTQEVTTEADTRPKSQVVYPTFDGAEAYLEQASEIVAAINRFKVAYDTADYDELAALYADTYEDANGFHVEYARRALRFWLDRNNVFCFLRQIRHWDFSDFKDTGRVRVRLFALCRALRRDDTPFGSQYDGTVRIPRTQDEEVLFTWEKDAEDGMWKIVRTEPALPNFQEILWNSRGADKTWLKLIPGAEGVYGRVPEGKTNLLPIETNWLPEMEPPAQAST